MSFGGIFYLNFISLTAQILNDGQKCLKPAFVRHSKSIWEQLPISASAPKVVKLLGNKIEAKTPILFIANFF